MRSISIAAAAAAIFALAASGVAAETTHATLSSVKGKVLVNSGTGFLPANGSTVLKTGDRVMVNAKSSAQLSFKDGCEVKLSPSIVTIGAVTPCAVKAVKAQGFFGTRFGGLPTIIGSGIVIGGSAFIIAEASKDDNKSP